MLIRFILEILSVWALVVLSGLLSKLFDVVVMQVTSKPQMIDEVDRRLIQLEMEKLSLRKETRQDGINRVNQIDKEMQQLKEKQVGFIRGQIRHDAHCDGQCWTLLIAWNVAVVTTCAPLVLLIALAGRILGAIMVIVTCIVILFVPVTHMCVPFGVFVYDI